MKEVVLVGQLAAQMAKKSETSSAGYLAPALVDNWADDSEAMMGTQKMDMKKDVVKALRLVAKKAEMMAIMKVEVSVAGWAAH